MDNPYDMLRVAKGADSEQVHAAYRKRVKELYPDRHSDSPHLKENKEKGFRQQEGFASDIEQKHMETAPREPEEAPRTAEEQARCFWNAYHAMKKK
jgi:hypothetical protein